MRDVFSDKSEQRTVLHRFSPSERLLRDAENAAVLRHRLTMIDIEAEHRTVPLGGNKNRP